MFFGQQQQNQWSTAAATDQLYDILVVSYREDSRNNFVISLSHQASKLLCNDFSACALSFQTQAAALSGEFTANLYEHFNPLAYAADHQLIHHYFDAHQWTGAVDQGRFLEPSLVPDTLRRTTEAQMRHQGAIPTSIISSPAAGRNSSFSSDGGIPRQVHVTDRRTGYNINSFNFGQSFNTGGATLEDSNSICPNLSPIHQVHDSSDGKQGLR